MPAMRLACLLLALALTAGACSNPPRDEPTDGDPMTDDPAEAMLSEPFTVEAGEAVRIADGSVTVRFDEVVSDNRCPVDVTCVQAGEAVARFTFIEDSRPDTPLTLRIDGGVTEVLDIDRYQFEQVNRFVAALLLLQPYPGVEDEEDLPMTATLEVRQLIR